MHRNSTMSRPSFITSICSFGLFPLLQFLPDTASSDGRAGLNERSRYEQLVELEVGRGNGKSR